MQEALKELDHVRLNFSTDNMIIINIALALIMFGVALGINISNFKRIVDNPKAAIVGIASQFLFLPFVTFLFIILMGNWITPTVAMGMILVASCPGGNISNFVSSMSKGNIALSVTLTAFATVMSVFLTPANFSFWGKLYASTSDLVRPLEIPVLQVFQTVFILLGIPLIVGILVRRYFPRFTLKLMKPMKIGSVVFFIILVVLAFYNNIDNFLKYIKFVFIIVLIHNIIAISTGYFLSSVFKLRRRDRRTVSIETGIQNSGLALVLIFNPKIFPVELEMGGMAFIAAWWGIWHIISGLGIAWFWSRIKIND